VADSDAEPERSTGIVADGGRGDFFGPAGESVLVKSGYQGVAPPYGHTLTVPTLGSRTTQSSLYSD